MKQQTRQGATGCLPASAETEIPCRRIFSHPARHRGSALILVTVSLVLMAMLGTTYIQLARIDRFSSSQLSDSGHTDVIINSVIAHIQSALSDDLVDGQGRMFNPRTPSDSTDPSDPDAGGGDEAFDYPFTRDSNDITPVAARWQVQLYNGDVQVAAGGEFDDTWLASTLPDFPTPTLSSHIWPHITNLNGIFLRNVGNTNFSMPTQDVVTKSGINNTDTDIRLDSALLVDADGDGIGDSRWTWAPIRKMGDVVYVMAVRIIDNSSMINANTALALSSSTGVYDTTSAGTNAPRWTSPSELDFARFVRGYTTLSPSLPNAGYFVSQDLPRLLGHRVDTTVMPTPWGNGAKDRHHYWLNGPAMYGDFQAGAGFNYKSLRIADELALRHRNGLKNPNSYASIEDLMPKFLRRDPVNDELTYEHVTGINQNDKQGYFERNPRHQMTVISGASIYAPRLDGMPVAGTITHNGTTYSTSFLIPGPSFNDDRIVLKQDINVLINQIANATNITNPQQQALTLDIRKVIEREWESQGSTKPFLPPPGLNDGVFNGLARAARNQAFANQFAACIVDYADADNLMTQVNGQYGMEAIPFITEVYVQAKYSYSSSQVTQPGDSMTWQLGTNKPGYAIEISNPFPHTISLQNIELWEVVGTTEKRWEVSSVQETLADLASQTTLDAGEVLVLYRNSNDSTVDSNDRVDSLITNSIHLTKKEMKNLATPTKWQWPITTQNVEFQLRSYHQAGSAMPWPYQRVPVNPIPLTFTKNNGGSQIPANTTIEDYAQRTSIGNGNGINMIALNFNDATTGFQRANEKEPVHPLPNPIRNTGFDSLGDASKPSGTPDSVLSSVSPTSQQIVISNNAIDQIGELAHIAILGPTATQTVAQVWHAMTTAPPNTIPSVKDFMLEFAPPNTSFGLVGLGNHAVPHAVMLLDRFTTLSPNEDGVDNDGDGRNDPNGSTLPGNPPNDDTNELFIPGTINLNTVSGDLTSVTNNSHLLQWVLPIPDAVVRTNIINGIIKYRDKEFPYNSPNRNPTVGIENYRNDPGIATMGELMQIVDRHPPISDETVDTLAKDTQDNTKMNGSNGTVIDFLPSSGAADGIADDREEEAMIARWLGQVCSTRSDIFTAYVVLEGYVAGQFNEDPVSSARFIAVFDRSRSSIDQSNNVRVFDGVRVLGVYRQGEGISYQH